jgi:hypothetical protein
MFLTSWLLTVTPLQNSPSVFPNPRRAAVLRLCVRFLLGLRTFGTQVVGFQMRAVTVDFCGSARVPHNYCGVCNSGNIAFSIHRGAEAHRSTKKTALEVGRRLRKVSR